MNTNKKYYLQKYKKYFDLSNPFNNKLYIDDPNNKIRVDSSSIHQSGVFANRNIAKNEIITYYPAHYIYKSDKIPIYKITKRLPKNYRDYIIQVKDDIILIGHPGIYENMNWVGHKINDGYKHNYKIINDKNINNYNKKSDNYNNSAFSYNKIDEIILVIATKNIKKNDEILVSYGFDYWLHRN